MSATPQPVRGLAQPGRDWLGILIATGVVIGAGWLVGAQLMDPNKRVLAVLAAVLMFGLAWRISMTMGLGVLLLALPFPRGTVFGSTSLAFILILFVIWLLRLSQRRAALPERTPVDVPIVGLLVSYIVSCYNLRNATEVYAALTNFQLFVACLLLFYVIVNNVRRTEDLKRFHQFQVASLVTVMLLGLWELSHPGQVFIPGWIDFSTIAGAVESYGIELHQTRVGGPFFDYELMCEYCALSFVLLIFLIAQARSATRKGVLTALLLVTGFLMFTTVTRGGFVALGLGLVYLGWLVRKRVNFVPLTILLVAGVVFFFGTNYYVSHFTASGDLVSRLGGTKFVGWMPETRAVTWPQAWERMMTHPILGHGPVFSARIGTQSYFWPHDLYLFVGNLVGLVGLSFFLAMLAIFWIITRQSTDRLDDPNYAKAFLIVAHVQLATFLLDEVKIEYLRNPIYQFQIWVMFASMVAGYMITRRERAAAPEPA